MDIGIIGCGAAGMMAAITAAGNGHKVTVLEHGSRHGKKLLATGNGRCNFTNETVDESFYNKSAEELFKSVYRQFDNKAVISFFEELGVNCVCKNGYYYPRSEQASVIADSLLFELERLGVSIITECNINNVVKNDNGFVVGSDKGDFEFDKLIIACGSMASPKTGSDGSGYSFAEGFGHNIIKPLPALCGLICSGFDFKSVSGVRCRAKVSLYIDNEYIVQDTGELQLADYGISGIPVFQISADAVRACDEGLNASVCIDFMPEKSTEEICEDIVRRAESGRFKTVSDLLRGMLNDKLARAIVKKQRLDDNDVKIMADKNKALILAWAINGTTVTVKGFKGFDNCQVCSGGVDCGQLKPSLESKLCEGLYFAGEIIDVNGLCGGYNLQWAWSSGYVAGNL